MKNYLDYLCDAFVVGKAIRYDIKGTNYIDTPHKYYFTDVGLRNARINFRQMEGNHTMEKSNLTSMLKKMNQESNPLLRIDDSFRKIIVVKETATPWYMEDGVLVIGVYDFLLQRDSLDL